MHRVQAVGLGCGHWGCGCSGCTEVYVQGAQVRVYEWGSRGRMALCGYTGWEG